MKAADIYFHSSINENCPYTILESIASATPVFAFSVGGIPEIINIKDCLIALEDDVEEVVKKINGYMCSTKKSKELAEKQLLIFNGDFTVETMIEKTLSNFRIVVNQNI
jgi:glycosyltransferase involved in cell wall biosynthesis